MRQLQLLLVSGQYYLAQFLILLFFELCSKVRNPTSRHLQLLHIYGEVLLESF
jgi:hypothetical protein